MFEFCLAGVRNVSSLMYDLMLIMRTILIDAPTYLAYVFRFNILQKTYYFIFHFIFNTCNFCYRDLLLSNDTFLFVKGCFTKLVVTLQSSVKATTVDRFGKENVCE